MRPCCEQEARDAIEDLGLVPDDDRTRTRRHKAIAGALRGVGRSEALGVRQRAARVLVALI